MTTTNGKSPAIPELSSDTRILESRLAELQDGEMIGYEELSRAIGRDVRAHAMHNLQSARRRLEKRGMVFGAVKGQGIKRLTPDGIVRKAESDVGSIARKSRRAMRTLACVEFEKLSDDEKVRHLAYSSQLGAVLTFAKPSANRKIVGMVQRNGTDAALPIGNTLKLFSE